MKDKMRFNTSLLHSNPARDKKTGATMPPIYQSSAFEQDSAEKLERVFLNAAPGYSYTRIGNPTNSVFEERMAVLEEGISAIACASGMAAIFNAIMNIVQSGDEIISGVGIFGGTMGLFQDLENFGVHTRYVMETTVEAIEEKITEHTKVIFAETLGNPKLDILDIEEISRVAHRHNIVFIVDNTLATPFLVKPITLGADIVIHSSSKYINGSGNSISGVIIDSGRFKWPLDRYPQMNTYRKMGPYAYTAKLRETIFRNTGACLSPFNAYLNCIGLETLGLRMERSCENALLLAQWFDRNKMIDKVNYPGLSSSPYHELAVQQFNNGFGAMVTIRMGTKKRAFGVINHLEYALKVSNIGDTKTLVIHPASTIYHSNSEKEKLNAGVYEDMIRISVGIEDIDNLIEDFEQAIMHCEDEV